MPNDLCHTYREILQQPYMWLKEYDLLLECGEDARSFVSKYIDQDYEVIYTGAGSSSYIGEILRFALCHTPFRGGRSVPTTDLITHPDTWFDEQKKVLLVSFARSGNSPESIAAVRIADTICARTAHVFITCNAEGELARSAAGRENTLLLLLPNETNDRSLAMTSSFSTMLFACMTLAQMVAGPVARERVVALANDARRILEECDRTVAGIASRRFDRAVFLGSGPLKGIAHESHLKLQELTDGGVACFFDSFLGFRHGPKAVIHAGTVLVYLFSPDAAVRRYETDLVAQINSNNRVVAQIAVGAEKVEIPGVRFDLELVPGPDRDIYSSLHYLFVAQLLGYYKSLELGLNPDTPSVSGNISRVVEGVTIYGVNHG